MFVGNALIVGFIAMTSCFDTERQVRDHDYDNDGFCETGDKHKRRCKEGPGDCDDTNGDVYPGSTKHEPEDICVIDEDGDGFGAKIIEGFVDPVVVDVLSEGQDCDDNNAEVHPHAEEKCDGIDNNCDGDIDEDVGNKFYRDNDGDGLGNPDESEDLCELESGYVENARDCSDQDVTVGDCQELDLGAGSGVAVQIEFASTSGLPGFTFGESVASSGELFAISAPAFSQVNLYDFSNPTVPLVTLLGITSESTGASLSFTKENDTSILYVGAPSGGLSREGKVLELDPLNSDFESARSWVGSLPGDGAGASLDAWPIRGRTGWHLVVGAPNALGGLGSVFLLNNNDLNDGRESLEDVGTKIVGNPQQRLGAHVAVVGDVDGDGANDVAVGSWNSTPTAEAYLVRWDPNFPIHSAHFMSKLTDPSSNLAKTIYQAGAGMPENNVVVGRAGDFDGDGLSDVLIGHPERDNDKGSVYLIYGQDIKNMFDQGIDGPPTPHAIAHGTETGDRLGTTIFSADVDVDGRPDLVVGAPHARGGRGLVYVVHDSSALRGDVNLEESSERKVLRILGVDDSEIGRSCTSILTPSGTHLLLGTPWYSTPEPDQNGVSFLISSDWLR